MCTPLPNIRLFYYVYLVFITKIEVCCYFPAGFFFKLTNLSVNQAKRVLKPQGHTLRTLYPKKQYLFIYSLLNVGYITIKN